MDELFDNNAPDLAHSGSLSVAVIEFCRLLHEYGIPVSATGSIIALGALQKIDISQRSHVRNTLLVTLINRPEDVAVFLALFETYWQFADNSEPETESDQQAEPTEDISDEHAISQDDAIEELLNRFSLEDFWRDDSESDEDAESSDQKPPQDTAEAERAAITTNDPRELKRLVQALTRQFAVKRSRRQQAHKHGKRVDLRKLMRSSVSHGGLPMILPRRRRKISAPRLLLFIDVSRSMASYAKLLLQFAAAVLRHSWRVEVFLFATKLVRVTHHQLEDREKDLNRIIAECGGGTRIGENLLSFERDYAHTLTGNQTVVVFLSDGLDSGEPELLESTLAWLKRRARQIIWLNPLLELQGETATIKLMERSLPYIDVLAPAHDVGCFWRLIDLLKTQSQEKVDLKDAS